LPICPLFRQFLPLIRPFVAHIFASYHDNFHYLASIHSFSYLMSQSNAMSIAMLYVLPSIQSVFYPNFYLIFPSPLAILQFLHKFSSILHEILHFSHPFCLHFVPILPAIFVYLCVLDRKWKTRHCAVACPIFHILPILLFHP